ncbi:MAG: M13 family metallopeptidase [Prevotellaceae bacterium]|jgi:putative endopeptidase|nr:M13 family metallopeptidase [Prevotellaceae bacterium]
MNRIIVSLIAIAILTTAAVIVTDNGVNRENMDMSAVAGDDFYQYACGGWMEKNPLKPEFARFGVFDKLRENSREQVKALIEELAVKTVKVNEVNGSVAQKIGDLYRMAIDSVRLNKEGAEPLKKHLKRVEVIKDKHELNSLIAEMFSKGMAPFFGVAVRADNMNSELNIMHLRQGGYKMGDRDYYLEQDARSIKLREQYTTLIERLFILSGYDKKQAKEASTIVVKIETQLANAAYSRVKLRVPSDNYHKITIEELQKASPALNWALVFKMMGIEKVKDLNLAQPEPLAEVSTIIREYSLQELKYYLKWNIISSASSYLSDDFAETAFAFYGKILSGKQEQSPRWKRAVDMVNGTLGEAVGQIYVQKYFPPAHKARMNELVKNLQTALGQRIDRLEWMSEATKVKAHEKLNSFRVKIGYPDKWKDYSNLKIDPNESYLENIVRSSKFEFAYMINKLGKPVDKEEWRMSPQTVNAYYSPSTNEICFPAAILQPPFFNMNADDAVNYGAIGVVIGHEMTHGFDDSGRQYDKNGNLAEWWTPNDAKKFETRADELVKFFDEIIVLDTVHANGRFTLGENIADQGGLQISWQAYHNTLEGKSQQVPAIGGFTAAQRFFLSYATIWAGNVRDAEILRLTKSDPHSLGRWRVNGALPHIDAWYTAFDVKETNKMYIPKEKRVAIW